MAEDDFALVVLYGIWRQHEQKSDTLEIATRLEKFASASYTIEKYDLDVVVQSARTINEAVTEKGFEVLERISSPFEENTALIRPTFYICIGLASIAFKLALVHASNRRQQDRYVRLINSVAGIIFLNGLHLQTKDPQFPKDLRRWLVWDKGKKKYKNQYKGISASVLYAVSHNFQSGFTRLPILSCYETMEGVDTKMKGKGRILRLTSPKTVPINLKSIFTTRMVNERSIPINTSLKSLLLAENCSLAQALKTFMEENKRIVKLNVPIEGLPPRPKTIYSNDTALKNVTKDQSHGNVSPNSDAVSRQRRAESLEPALESSRMADLTFPCHYYGTRPIGPHEFFGRGAVMDQIEEAFMPNELPATAQALQQQHQTKIFCITGPGGIGKTRIAVEYTAARSLAFDVIAWLDASDSANLLNGYQDFAVSLGLLSTEEVESSDLNLVMSYVNGWLTKPVRNRARPEGPFMRWLVVWDNVKDPTELLSRFWPAGNPPGCLLVTGRPSYLQTSSCFGNVGAQIDPLSVDDAVQLLLQLTNKKSEPDAVKSAQSILSDWDRFPISIMCVVSVIQRSGDSLADCAALSPGHRRRYLASAWGFKGKLYNLASMWAISDLKKGERALLNVLSLLDSTCIPDDLLTSASPAIGMLSNYPADCEAYGNLKISLWKGALIQRVPGKRAVSIHQVFQETILARLSNDPEELLQTFSFAATLLSSVWPAVVTKDIDFSNDLSSERQSKNKDLFPHVKRLRCMHEDLRASTGGSCLGRHWLRLLLEAAWYKFEQSDFLTSESIVNDVRRDIDISDEESSDFILAALDVKTQICSSLNRCEEALKHIQGRIDILEKKFEQSGRATHRLCAAYSERAMALVAVGNFAEAAQKEILELLSKSSGLRQNLPDFDEQQLFNARRTEGMFYLHSGHPKKAEECFLRALRVREKKLGVDDQKTFRTGLLLWDLGNAYYRQGLWEQGLDHFKRALKSMIASSGDQHLQVARTHYKIALYYLRDNRSEYTDLATVNLEKALKIYEQKPMHLAEQARALYVLHEAEIKASRADGGSSKLMTALAMRKSFLEERDEKQRGKLHSRDDFDALCSLTGR